MLETFPGTLEFTKLRVPVATSCPPYRRVIATEGAKGWIKITSLYDHFDESHQRTSKANGVEKLRTIFSMPSAPARGYAILGMDPRSHVRTVRPPGTLLILYEFRAADVRRTRDCRVVLEIRSSSQLPVSSPISRKMTKTSACVNEYRVRCFFFVIF